MNKYYLFTWFFYYNDLQFLQINSKYSAVILTEEGRKNCPLVWRRDTGSVSKDLDIIYVKEDNEEKKENKKSKMDKSLKRSLRLLLLGICNGLSNASKV